MSLSQEISAPTAGDAGADTGTTAPASAPAAPSAQTPSERTYTQAEFDTHAAGLRRSEQARYERQLAQERERIRVELTNPKAPQDPIVREVGTLRNQMSRFQLDSAVAQVSKQYPNFNEKAVLQLIVDRGLDRLDAPYEEILDLAYRIWDRDTLAGKPPVDVEAIKKAAKDEAIREYTSKKVETASKTPRTEGTGGSAPVSAKKITKSADLDAAIGAALDRIQ